MVTNENIVKGTRFRLGYQPALDGLRAVAILLVLLTHLRLIPTMYGSIGVDMFFVLSGFLITCLLVEEWDQTGGISLWAFYARRVLRLLPALVAMLAAFMVYSHFCREPRLRLLDAKEALIALLYCMNWAIALDRFWPVFLQHTWSLSIEEQFYLIWPGLLLLLLRRSPRKSLFYFLVFMAVLAWLNRFLQFAGTTATNWRISCGLDTRADSLLIGGAIGVAISSKLLTRPRWLRLALMCGSAISFAGLGLMGAIVKMYSASLMYVGWFLISLFSGIIILELVVSKDGVFSRALSCAPLVWLGRVSYGVYLWHYPVILALNETRFSLAKGHWYMYVVVILLVTVASYYLIERPFLRLKRRFQKAT